MCVILAKRMSIIKKPNDITAVQCSKLFSWNEKKNVSLVEEKKFFLIKYKSTGFINAFFFQYKIHLLFYQLILKYIH